MKKMLFITALALAAFLIVLGLAGCGGGRYDPAGDEAAIRAAIDRFVQGVQEYSVAKMTDRLSASNFVLTLREGDGTPYTKDYATLMAEVGDPKEGKKVKISSEREDSEIGSYGKGIRDRFGNYQFLYGTNTNGDAKF